MTVLWIALVVVFATVGAAFAIHHSGFRLSRGASRCVVALAFIPLLLVLFDYGWR